MSNNAEQLFREGQSHQFADPPDYLSAERCYQTAVDVFPQWGEPYHCLAFVIENRKDGDLAKAANLYRRAIDLLPNDPRPLISLGRLQHRRGEVDEAIHLLEAGLALKPHYAEADARLMLADAYKDGGKTEDAINQWHIVAAMEPFYPSHGKLMEEAKQKLIAVGARSAMTTQEIQRWATAWIEAQEVPKISTEHPLWWAVEQFKENGYQWPTAEERWQTILEILRCRPPQHAIGMLAAGPMDDLIDEHGPDFIERIELEACRDPAFRQLLCGCWESGSRPEIWDRVQQARGEIISD